MNYPDEQVMELTVLNFLKTCSVDDYVALYEHMNCVKLKLAETDTLELKYIVEHSQDEIAGIIGAADVGREVSFDEVSDIEKYLEMTDCDLKLLYEAVVEL